MSVERGMAEAGLQLGRSASGGWGRATIEVPCTVDLEQTPDALHAYVDLQGVNVGPGDEVIVHDAPNGIAFGESAVYRRTASVRRAGPLQRAWAYIEGYLELTELYEVSFSEGKAR
jgi:hypothetical protein